MLSLWPTPRILVALQPMDMRKGFNGLYTWVKSVLQEEPTSGHWFVFLNQRRNRVKILTYDGSGLWILNKKLERGTFSPVAGEGQSLGLRPEDLLMLLHGMESPTRRAWHRL